MALNNYHISPSGTSWKLTFGGQTLVAETNKAPVVATGRAVAKKNPPSELIIQNSDGKIAERETYGDDPYPPRG